MLYGTTNRNQASRFLREIPVSVTDDITVQSYVPHSKFGSFAQPAHSTSSSAAHKFGQVGGAASSSQRFAAGDTVRHKAFGTGMVISARELGNDTLLEVAFDKEGVGTKKLMANYAKLEKL